MYPPSTQLYPYLLFLSFQVYFLLFSHSVVFDSLQQARLPCPLPTPRDCANSCPLSQWCHPTIFIAVAPFFSCLLSFLASGSFLVSWLFTSDDQCIGASARLILFVEMIMAITCSSSWVYQNSRSGEEGKKSSHTYILHSMRARIEGRGPLHSCPLPMWPLDFEIASE